MIPFSGVFERTLADMLPDEAAKYCEENKLQRLVTKQPHMSWMFFFMNHLSDSSGRCFL